MSDWATFAASNVDDNENNVEEEGNGCFGWVNAEQKQEDEGFDEFNEAPIEENQEMPDWAANAWGVNITTSEVE